MAIHSIFCSPILSQDIYSTLPDLQSFLSRLDVRGEEREEREREREREKEHSAGCRFLFFNCFRRKQEQGERMREWREKTSDSNEYTHLRFLSCILHLLLLSPHAINSEMGFSRIFLVIFSPFFRLLSFRFVPFLLSLSFASEMFLFPAQIILFSRLKMAK